MIGTAMRKSFAVLLIGSWMSLSGVEPLEARQLTSRADLQLSEVEFQSHGDVENEPVYAALIIGDQPVVYEPAGLLSRPHGFAGGPKPGKIYKVLRVFLI
jgi:hypothetical protein